MAMLSPSALNAAGATPMFAATIAMTQSSAIDELESEWWLTAGFDTPATQQVKGAKREVNFLFRVEVRPESENNQR